MGKLISTYNNMAKEIVKDAMNDGQELRYFNNLFVEIASELINKRFEFEGTVFKTDNEVFDFLITTLNWTKELNKED